MLQELLSLFRSHDAMSDMAESFSEMLERANDITVQAGQFYFERPPTSDERSQLLRDDVKINKLERAIRKKVITHLTLQSDHTSAPFCLLLMSLVKDVERIGDYAKNLSEVYDEGGGPLPGDENEAELRELRRLTEYVFGAVATVFEESDESSAHELIRVGLNVSQRSDRLVPRIAHSGYDAATTTTMVLGTRYYKRIAAHLTNVLSGVVMPLHKLDYYDESSAPEADSEDSA